MELRYGAIRKKDNGRLWKRIEQELVNCYNILDFKQEEASCAGDILADLSRFGIMIEVEDAMIAATALSHNLILVTGNEKHFRRIPRLKIENWLRDDA
jgi:tRNA(fMet)-specific endonuclease VapC